MAPKKVTKRVKQYTIDPCPPANAVLEVVESKSIGRSTRRKHAKFEPNRSAGTFDKYIGELMKLIEKDPNNPEISKSSQFVSVMNDWIIRMVNDISENAVLCAAYNEKKTVREHDIYQGIGNVFSGNLARSAQIAGAQAKNMRSKYSVNDNTKTSEKANIVFSPSRVEKMLRSKTDKNVCEDAGVIIAAAVERVVQEVLTIIMPKMISAGIKRMSVSHVKTVATKSKTDSKGAELADVMGSSLFISDR
jgi:histone H3/H4